MSYEKHKTRTVNSLIETEITSKFIEINDIKIHYMVGGKGPSLLLLHGANIGWGQWYPNIDDLAKHFCVYALDLPGTGQSTRFDYSLADFKKDYVDIVAKFIQMQNLQGVNIIGHSFGAAIAAKLAIYHPNLVAKIVLANPLGLIKKISLKQRGISSKVLAKFITKTAMKPNRKNMAKFLKSAVYDSKILTEPFIDYYYEMVKQDKRSHPLLFMHSQTRGFRFNPALLYGDELAQIQQPILVILGEDDPLLPSKKIATFVRSKNNVKLKVFKQTGHVTTLEQSKHFNETVINFLK